MSVMQIGATPGFAGIQTGNLEGLISTHFNRAYLMVNLFIDDPRACLDITESLFRAVDLSEELTEIGVYTELVRKIANLPRKNELLAGFSYQGMMCWLLKENSSLKYADIAAMMGLERDQVKCHIADVRGSLLG